MNKIYKIGISTNSGTMKYFAYGSNMCLGKLRMTTPSCKFITIAKLKGYLLQFHKRSRDGSGKADAYQTDDPNDEVWGVVFEIKDSEKPKLDKSEGLCHGYNECKAKVISNDGTVHEAYMYYADKNYIQKGLRPYTWYKRFVIEGAKQHKLPLSYISKIEKVKTKKDSNSNRNRNMGKIQCD